MTLEWQLRLAGAMQIALAALHVTFPRRFRWKEELDRLSLLNRQMFLVHTAFVCFVLLLFGTLSLLAPQLLLDATPLARFVSGGIAAFWLLRLVVQLFVYDPSLWRGDRFNTLAHVGFSLIWSYFVVVYGGALLLPA